MDSGPNVRNKISWGKLVAVTLTMLGGERSFIITAVGLMLLVCTFGYGLMLGASGNSGSDRYEAYRYAADKQIEVEPSATAQPDAQPFQFRTPCSYPRGKDESDLCAQWNAANAAEDSAFWAKWGFLVTCIGAAGLIVTINQSRIGLARAREANELAHQGLVGQLRPWIDADVKVKKGPYLDGKGQWRIHFHGKIQNLGQSPALQVNIWPTLCVMDPERFMQESIGELKREPIQWDGSLVMPGRKHPFNFTIDFEAESRDVIGPGLNNQRLPVYLIFAIQYRTTLDDDARHHTIRIYRLKDGMPFDLCVGFNRERHSIEQCDLQLIRYASGTGYAD